MARPGVTYQDIAKAANDLKEQGKNITIENIRNLLGTGSIGTINKYLRQWKDIQSSTSNLLATENLPEEFSELMKALWDSLIKQAAEKFVIIEKNLQTEIAELKQELEKYKNNNRRWQKLFNEWQQQEKFSPINVTLEKSQG